MASDLSPAVKVEVIANSSQLPGESWILKRRSKHRRKMTRPGSLIYSVT
jgi:hypothetical protein